MNTPEIIKVTTGNGGSSVDVVRLEDHLEAINAAKQESAKDKARLDWLESTKSGCEFNDRLGHFTVQKSQQVCGCIGNSRDLRAAIDTAMEATLNNAANKRGGE